MQRKANNTFLFNWAPNASPAPASFSANFDKNQKTLFIVSRRIFPTTRLFRTAPYILLNRWTRAKNRERTGSQRKTGDLTGEGVGWALVNTSSQAFNAGGGGGICFINRLHGWYVVCFLRGAGMAQWWERSPSTNVSRVRFPDPASYVGWVCWFSTLLREVFLRELRFSPLLKNQDLIWFDLFDLQSPQLVQHSCSARMIWDSNKVIIIIEIRERKN